MDMDWYFRCESVLACYQYFSRLEPGDGRRTAIYDIINKKYLWIADDSKEHIDRLDRIVAGAIKKIKKNR